MPDTADKNVGGNNNNHTSHFVETRDKALDQFEGWLQNRDSGDDDHRKRNPAVGFVPL
jgi:hypothetical protein